MSEIQKEYDKIIKMIEDYYHCEITINEDNELIILKNGNKFVEKNFQSKDHVMDALIKSFFISLGRKKEYSGKKASQIIVDDIGDLNEYKKDS